LRQNNTLSLLRNGQPAIGLWMHNQSLHITRALAAQGLFDWLMVDLEHTPTDSFLASALLAAIGDISGGKCTPLARVAHGSMYHIKQALDSGAQGIVVPMVNTAEDARNVVGFARYAPEGERGGGGFVPHLAFGLTNHAEYISKANREIMVAVQIETAAAVENIEEIVEVPGLDMVFIGPFDLHLSLGLSPSLWSDSPVFQAAIEKVTKACRTKQIPLGTLTASADGTKARLAGGFTFIGMGVDVAHLLNAVKEQYAQLQSVLPAR
jgi:4-hydroxy-2-oxoheptanedioate aldolase